MFNIIRIAHIFLLILFVLQACGTAQSYAPTPAELHNSTPTPAVTPSPTTTPTHIVLSPIPKPTFPDGTLAAGVDIGNLTTDMANEKLHKELPAFERPLELYVGQEHITLYPDDIGLQLDVDNLLIEAYLEAARNEAADIQQKIKLPLEITYDEQQLQTTIKAFADEVIIPAELGSITTTDTISRSFTYFPGRVINVEKALYQVQERLRVPYKSRRIALELRDDYSIPGPIAGLEQIAQQVQDMAQSWYGVLGFYVYDIESGKSIGYHENTVFSGASVMKAAILLQAYISLPEFTEEQSQWIHNMIAYSDNLAANYVLAAAASGEGTEDALTGVYQMNETLEKMGLQHTYQYMPYESHEYLVLLRGIEIKQGPPEEGEPPYTDADISLRTTPAEISQVFLTIDQCSKGSGYLLETYTQTLTLERCQDMLDVLAQNEDTRRIRAGIPPHVRVEHKSGWINDMEADVGIVRSPGGDFILAVFLYQQEGINTYSASETIANFARMVYTAYNPIPVGGTP